jgi:hypothetical protein
MTTVERRIGVLVGLGLAVTAAAHLIAGFVPEMALWGINLDRHLGAIPGWGAWLLGGVAIAAWGPRLEAWSALAAARLRAAIGPLHRLLPLAAAALVLAHPDRTWFLGDFLWRGSYLDPAEAQRFFPQLLPIERLLHDSIPYALAGSDPGSRLSFSRLLGALEAAAFALVALRFARERRLAGGSALAVASAILFGGWLATLTGYARASGEVALLTAATAVLGLDAIRSGAGLVPLGIVVAVALATHRSLVGLLPGAAVALAVAARRHGRGDRAVALHARLAAAVIGAVALLLSPRYAAIFASFDWSHNFVPPSVGASGGILAAAFAPLHLLDVANAMLLLAPLALLALLLLPWALRRPGRGAEVAFLLALVLPALGQLLFVHPAKGVFRDWDIFTPAGVSWSALGAWMLAEVAERHALSARLALAVALVAAVPTIQLLALQHDPERGLARAQAFATEAPRRGPALEASVWDFIGERSVLLGRWDAAAEAYAQAVRGAPTPRLNAMLGVTLMVAGRGSAAARLGRERVGHAPDDALAWMWLAASAAHSGDSALADAATARLRSVARDAAARERLRRFAREFPEVWPGGVVPGLVDSTR